MAELDLPGMAVPQQATIETTEIFHAFNYGVNMIEDTVTLDIILLKTYKRVQLVFGRLEWTVFVKGLVQSAERMESMRAVAEENGNAADN